MEKLKYNIKPFTGEKYSIWKFRVRALLTELEVLKVIDDEKPNKDDVDWIKANLCAKNILIAHLGDSFLGFASSDATAREVFKNLDAVYERKSLASQLSARKRLLALKHSGEMSLSNFFIIFDELISELSAAGAKVDEMDKVSHLLLTLPSSYNGVITAIETLSEENLTLAFVKNRLLDHEIKIRNDQKDTSKKVMKVLVQNNNHKKNYQKYSSKNKITQPINKFKHKQLGNIKCHHCGKMGHIKKDCYHFKRISNLNKNNNTNKVNESPNENIQAQTITSHGIAFMVTNHETDKYNFILDSGASDHLINNVSLYADYVELEPPLKIAVAKQGQFIYATKRGVVRLRNNCEITLEDVLYCKEASGNLISVKRLQEAGLTTQFDRDGVTISKNGLTIIKDSENQIADVFTKPLPAPRFMEMRNRLGLLKDADI